MLLSGMGVGIISAEDYLIKEFSYILNNKILPVEMRQFSSKSHYHAND